MISKLIIYNILIIMSDNEDNQEKFEPYSNTGNKDDPISRSEYNARNMQQKEIHFLEKI